MRRLLAQITDRLQAFTEQRDVVALVVTSPTADSLPILTILEGVENNSASDLFWTFTNTFSDASQYAEAVVDAFSVKHEAVRLAMAKEGMTPWPAIPPGVRSTGTPPTQRLRELAAFSRELLPVAAGGNCVWVFYPLEIADPSAFAWLIAELLHHSFPNPWFHHLRFIIREDPAVPSLRAHLADWPRVQWYQPDLSAEAVQKSLMDEAADPALQVEERLGYLVLLAGSDQANGRYVDALEKYSLLLKYHAAVGNHAMAALALNGMGETYEKLGDPERAADSYEAALIPASHGDHPSIPVLLNAVTNLGNLRQSQQRWAEGEAYHDMAQQLAMVARNGTARVQALDSRGVCQRQQGKLQDAETSWHDGAAIAAQLEELDLCRLMVARLQHHYKETGEYEKERERSAQLEALGGVRKG